MEIKLEKIEFGTLRRSVIFLYGSEVAMRSLPFKREDFCFVAEDDGDIAGVIVGRAYYNEVHIGDLIVGKDYRRAGVGSKLVAAVEEAYKGKGYEKIALTTFGFQAPEFYKKLGYELEFIREDANPKLSKYFYLKKI